MAMREALRPAESYIEIEDCPLTMLDPYTRHARPPHVRDPFHRGLTPSSDNWDLHSKKKKTSQIVDEPRESSPLVTQSTVNSHSRSWRHENVHRFVWISRIEIDLQCDLDSWRQSCGQVQTDGIELERGYVARSETDDRRHREKTSRRRQLLDRVDHPSAGTWLRCLDRPERNEGQPMYWSILRHVILRSIVAVGFVCSSLRSSLIDHAKDWSYYWRRPCLHVLSWTIDPERLAPSNNENDRRNGPTWIKRRNLSLTKFRWFCMLFDVSIRM